MKVKKRCNKIKEDSLLYQAVVDKLKILENTSCVLSDIVNDEQYIRLYYPLNDAIRNKDYLTLMIPVYANHISKILTMSSKGMIVENEASTTVILQKEGAVRAMEYEMNNDKCDVVKELCIISVERVPIMILPM